MKLKQACLRNFRRLEDVTIDFEDEETVFVGPNNSGKTSATTAFRLFLLRQEFKVYDFSVPRIAEIDAFGYGNEDEGADQDVGQVGEEDDDEPTRGENDEEADVLPSIEMDLWFSLDPDIEYGRVHALITNVSTDLAEVGVRLRLSATDVAKLKEDYLSRFPPAEDDSPPKSLSHFLSLPSNMSRYFGLSYFALERGGDAVNCIPLSPEEGRQAIRSLIRVDFVDAQRGIDDHEVGRSNRLSAAFSAFYRKNLEQAEMDDDANRIIDENNERLTKHYETHFTELFDVIRNLGVPSVNDRELKLISAISPEVALKGNTALLYVDSDRNHELPEAYNGLGFKNLIFMAIQISHFHIQWMNTETQRPLCQMIFVEEPEVHLHAQVQQTFISNIWRIVRAASKKAGEEHMIPQIGISTHSSHILDAVEFGKVRYFRKCLLNGEEEGSTTTMNASKVLNLRDYKPEIDSTNANDAEAGGEADQPDHEQIEEERKKTFEFLRKYLRLTHCDLFFADAAVLVEGAAEKLLLPTIIDRCAKKLKRNYLTVLEIGGAYAHKFAGLVEFLGIPYLVITDIDAVDPNNNRSACRADKVDAITSNKSLEFFFKKKEISELSAIPPDDHLFSERKCYVAFQKPSQVYGHADNTMHGRTFEEAFVYENLQLVLEGKLEFGANFPGERDHEQEFKTVYNRVKSQNFKKTEFALNIASCTEEWIVPEYICQGLKWLESQLESTAEKPLPEQSKTIATARKK